MNNTATAIEEPSAGHEPESADWQPGKYSGIVLPPFDPEAAIATLRSFYEGDPEEQRETFEYLKKALNEDRAAGGERLLFIDDDE